MGKEIKVRVVLRHNTTEGWKLVEDTAVLFKGEIGLEFTAGSSVPKIKIGDGHKPWKGLEYFTVALPERYTWGDLYGTVLENETEYDDSLQVEGSDEKLTLKYPGYPETVNIRDINTNFSNLSKKITSDIEVQIQTIKNQISKFLGGWEGSDAPQSSIEQEIVDARTRFNNAEYGSLGAAIRAIDEDLFHLTEQMSDFIGSSAIDGLYYEGNKLWVASNGQPIGDPVEIVSGSGGGGTGGGSSYTISLTNLLDSRIISVAKGEQVVLEYNYKSSDAEGYNDGPGVGTIFVGNIKRASITVPQGNNSIDVTNFLSDGDNTVKIQVTNSDGTSRSLTYTITIVSLAITTTATDMSLYSGEYPFPYTVTGAGTKNVYFLMDGKQIGKETITSSGRSYYFNIPVQEDGAHILEAYAELTTGATTIRSNVLRMGMMWYSTSMSNAAILINNTVEKIVQGETLTIPYLVYKYGISEYDITLTIIDENGKIYSEKNLTVDGTVKYWNTQDFPIGLTVFKISLGKEASEAIQIQVEASSFTREIITSGLLLEFSPDGRDNAEENPEYWSYQLKDDAGRPTELLEASFEGFGWATVDGWYKVPIEENSTEYQTVLRFLPGNTMNIPYAPFKSQTIKESGFSVEIELETHNVKDSETTIFASYKDGKGLIVQASSAQLSATASSVSARFREDSKVRVTFVVEPVSVNRFIYIYIDGIMCGVSQYTNLDDFTQDNIISIGAESSGLDLYAIRFYRRALSEEEQLNNFICDRPTLSERIKYDKENDIFNASGDITIDTLPMNIPYIIMECEELPQFKGDKKKGKSVTYVDRINTNRSFTAVGCQFDVQGTSSQYYPIKNYKIGLKKGITYTNTGEENSNGFPVFEGGIPGKNICLKADFASSENANNVMLVDYYEGITPFDGNKPYPPADPTSSEYIDDRCRRAIRGFACVVFWKNTTTNEIKFVGKYNFNDDKSNENVFGFDQEINPATECWEFCNNTSSRVIFKDTDFFEGESNSTDWIAGKTYSVGDIVVHNCNLTLNYGGNSKNVNWLYPFKSLVNNNTTEPSLEDTTNWERIPWKEDVFEDFEPRFPDLDDMYSELSAFYRMARWLVSTDTTVTAGPDATLTINGTTFSDTPTNRLRKFKEEFENYFIKDATLFYYIFTEVFLMVDSRAKNLFLTTFDSTYWFPIPYDCDTAIGINNEGKLVFDYDLEDTDKSGDANVFNGQMSTLWCNIRDAFPDDLRAMYIALRNDNEKPFNYESIKTKMENHQKTWPEALWNEDSYFKYLESYLTKNEDYLAMLQGNKASQRDWWLYYAFKYRDSKYRTGEAQSTYISLRLYDRLTDKLTIKPYSNIWIWAKFGSYEKYMRAKKNQYFDLEIPDINFNDTECAIYSADCLSEIGDLSPLKVGLVNVAAATKLETLILGSSEPGYVNNSFEGVNVGANELLSLLNIENCVIDYTKHSSAGVIDLSNCHGIEIVKAKGSNIKSVILPDGGHLKTLELPSTLTGFNIKNQKYFETMELEGYNKIVTLNLENTPNLPIETLLLNCPLQRLRLKNIEWTVKDATTLERIYRKLVAKNTNGGYVVNGYNDSGNNVEKAQISGKVYVNSISNDLIELINTDFPELVVVTNGASKFFIKYINKDNSELYSYIADQGSAAIDPVATGKIETPTYTGSGDTRYTYKGWENLPTNIQKPQIILVDYEETYRVRFFKDETKAQQYTEIGEQWILEGGPARDPVEENLISTPTKTPTAQYSFIYKGWVTDDTLINYIEDLSIITKPLDLYPAYTNIINTYTVRFESNGELLQEQTQVPYGETVKYNGNVNDIPYYEEEGVISEVWEFEKWDRSLLIEPEQYTTDPIVIQAIFIFTGNLNEITWEQIADAAAKGEVNKYGVGSTKDLILTINGTTYTVTMELIAKDYDYLSSDLVSSNYNKGKPTAAFTFMTKDTSPEKKPIQITREEVEGPGIGGWKDSELRKDCNKIYQFYIPTEVKAVIKRIQKKTDEGYVGTAVEPRLIQTEETVWVPSATELNLDSSNNINYKNGQTMNPDGKAYGWFSDDNSRKRKVNGQNVTYWTRTQAKGLLFRYIAINKEGKLETQIGSYDFNFPFGFNI